MSHIRPLSGSDPLVTPHSGQHGPGHPADLALFPRWPLFPVCCPGLCPPASFLKAHRLALAEGGGHTATLLTLPVPGNCPPLNICSVDLLCVNPIFLVRLSLVMLSNTVPLPLPRLLPPSPLALVHSTYSINGGKHAFLTHFVFLSQKGKFPEDRDSLNLGQRHFPSTQQHSTTNKQRAFSLRLLG